MSGSDPAAPLAALVSEIQNGLRPRLYKARLVLRTTACQCRMRALRTPPSAGTAADL